MFLVGDGGHPGGALPWYVFLCSLEQRGVYPFVSCVKTYLSIYTFLAGNNTFWINRDFLDQLFVQYLLKRHRNAFEQYQMIVI
jgi:hypothetical protein